jgi:hypothetical protein
VPAHLRRLTDSAYLAAGLAVLLVAAAIQYGLFAWLLRPTLRSGNAAGSRPVFVRWILSALAFPAVVLIAAAAYMILVGRRHPQGLAWAAPPLAALVGTALPLQLVIASITRAARR